MDSLIGVTLPYYHITILQYHNMPSTFYYIKNVELEQYCNEYIWPRYFFSTPVWRILITIKMNFRYVGMSPRDMMSVLPTPDQWWVPFHTSVLPFHTNVGWWHHFSLRCLTQLTVNDSLKSMYLYTDPIAKGDVDNKVLKT